MADALEFYDGGAFADCFFVQYPGGLGLKPASHSAMKMIPSSVASAPATQPPSATISTALTLSGATSSGVSVSVAKPSPSVEGHLAEAAETAERTRKALEQSLRAAATTASTSTPGLVNKRGQLANVLDKEEAKTAAVESGVFDGSQIALHRIERKNNIGKNVAANVRDLVITVPSGSGDADDDTTSTTAPIVRSPTKSRKIATAFTKHNNSDGALTIASGAAGDGVNDELFTSDKGKDVAVPFCVSNWRNKKNLLVPLAVRVAQHEQAMGDTTANTLGDAIIDLATTMQEASREVEAEMEAKARAREEEEERRQAALEAEEAERAKQLLQQNAVRQQASFQRRESREQRLERIRLERELRELEKREKQRQRLLEKAAARLNVTVEALEADEALLRAVEASGTGATTTSVANTTIKMEHPGDSGLGGYPGLSANMRITNEDEDEYATTRLQRGGLKSSVLDVPVISNEGILREMVALQKAEEDVAALKALQQPHAQPHVGAKTARQSNSNNKSDGSSGDEDGSDDELDGLEVGALMNQKRRRL